MFWITRTDRHGLFFMQNLVINIWSHNLTRSTMYCIIDILLCKQVLMLDIIAPQNQKAISASLQSKEILSFGIARTSLKAVIIT